MIGGKSLGRHVSMAALGMLCGCYVYVPVLAVEPHAGTHVAAELTRYGTDTLAPYVGPGVTTLHGDIVREEDTTVVLALTSVTDRSGREQAWKGEQVRVPRAVVENLLERRFSLGRSLLLGATFLGASVAAWEAFRGGTSGGSLPSGGGSGVPR